MCPLTLAKSLPRSYWLELQQVHLIIASRIDQKIMFWVINLCCNRGSANKLLASGYWEDDLFTAKRHGEFLSKRFYRVRPP